MCVVFMVFPKTSFARFRCFMVLLGVFLVKVIGKSNNYLLQVFEKWFWRGSSLSDKEVRVSKIKDGTVIDHISGGYALDVAKILGITGHERQVVTIAINVPSKRFRVKDIVKIEGRALNRKEVDRIALIAPRATINIIQNFIVLEKLEVKLPKIIEDIVKCNSPMCVSNSNEPISPKFTVENEEPLMLKCNYCGYILEKADLLKQF